MLAVGVEVIAARFGAAASQDPAVRDRIVRQAVAEAEGRHHGRVLAWLRRRAAEVVELLARLRPPRIAVRLPHLQGLRAPRPKLRAVTVPAVTRAGPAIEPVKIGAP